MTAQRNFAANDRQPATGAFEPTPEYTPSFTLDRDLAQWRAETTPERQAQLEAEWQEGIRQSREEEAERIRVKYGRGSPQFRRAAMRCVGGTLASKIGEVI